MKKAADCSPKPPSGPHGSRRRLRASSPRGSDCASRRTPSSRGAATRSARARPDDKLRGVSRDVPRKEYCRGFAFSRRELRPRFASCPPSSMKRAQGMPGARCTRGLACSLRSTKNTHEHTGSAEAVRHPLRSGFTAYIALSSGNGLSCPRHPRDAKHHRELDASVGAPGPRDFAVRKCAVRLPARPRPPHPASYVRDDRETPLWWRRDAHRIHDFLFLKSRISLRPDRLDRACEFRDIWVGVSEQTRGPSGKSIVRPTHRKVEIPAAKLAMKIRANGIHVPTKLRNIA